MELGAGRFNPSRFAVDPIYGVLEDKKAASAPVSFNPTTFQLDPGLCERLGVGAVRRARYAAGCMKGHLFNPAPRLVLPGTPWATARPRSAVATASFLSTAPAMKPIPVRSKPARLSSSTMTQPLPVSYPCIGNVGYGSVSDLPTVVVQFSGSITSGSSSRFRSFLST